jgi:predicted RNase H-like HicB family nuclease
MSEILFETIIYWDAEDQIFVVEIPELPGCTAHGATKQVALQNVEEAAQLWLETAREDGIEIPQPRGRLLFA